MKPADTRIASMLEAVRRAPLIDRDYSDPELRLALLGASAAFKRAPVVGRVPMNDNEVDQ